MRLPPLRTALALLALGLALAAVAVAVAADKPAKVKTKSAAVAVVAPAPDSPNVLVQNTVSILAWGLAPGTAYDATFQAFAEDGGYPYTAGAGTYVVKPTGQIVADIDLSTILYYRPRLDHVVAWLRPPGSTVDAVSNDPAGRPIRGTIQVDVEAAYP